MNAFLALNHTVVLLASLDIINLKLLAMNFFRLRIGYLVFLLLVGLSICSQRTGWAQTNEFETRDEVDIIADSDVKSFVDTSSLSTTRGPVDSDYSSLRDPFEPFNLTPQFTPNPLASPLESYSLSQLQFKAVIRGAGVLKGLVEDEQGRGFYVSVGSRIGKQQGIVQAISEKKITIQETQVKFTGEKQESITELFLKKG